MANEASKKVVVIRKKAERPKQKDANPAPALSGAAATVGKGPSEKRKARRKRQTEKWREAHPGLRFVQFVIEIELWNQFVARCCAEHRPNVVFTRMIREAVERSEAIEEILTRDKPM